MILKPDVEKKTKIVRNDQKKWCMFRFQNKPCYETKSVQETRRRSVCAKIVRKTTDHSTRTDGLNIDVNIYFCTTTTTSVRDPKQPNFVRRSHFNENHAKYTGTKTACVINKTHMSVSKFETFLTNTVLKIIIKMHHLYWKRNLLWWLSFATQAKLFIFYSYFKAS